MNSFVSCAGLPVSTQVRFADQMQKMERNHLGFVPRDSLEAAIRRRRLFVLHSNGDPIGHVLFGQRRGLIHVHQLVVRKDARRIEHATLLLGRAVSEVCDRNPWAITCRVAHDIDAHLFWQALGFDPVGLTYHSIQSSRHLIIYARSLPWCRDAMNTLNGFSAGLARGSLGTLDHGRSTPQDAENASSILERHLLRRQPVGKSVAELDSALRSGATSLCQVTIANPGNDWPSDST